MKKNNEITKPFTFNNWSWTEFDCYYVYAENKSNAEKLVSPYFPEMDRRFFALLNPTPVAVSLEQNISKLNESVAKFVPTVTMLKDGLDAIFYFETTIRECEGYVSKGAKVSKCSITTPGKFKTIYEACVTAELLTNQPAALSSKSKAHVIELAKEAAEQNDCLYTIRKRMVLEENDNDSLIVATVSPAKKAVYSKRKLYCFFGVNPERNERKIRQHEKWSKR